MNILSFEFVENEFKTGRFEFDNLEIVGGGCDTRIYFDDVRLYLDGELYTGGISTWAENNVSTSFLFDSILNSYLRDNTAEFRNFEGFEIFDSLKKMKVSENGLLIKFPAYNYGVDMYELDLATPDTRYYHNDSGSFLVLDEGGKVITDMECFYETAFSEDMCSVLKGEVECLYESKTLAEMIEEMGGAEEYLAEYDEEEI